MDGPDVKNLIKSSGGGDQKYFWVKPSILNLMQFSEIIYVDADSV